MRNSSLVEGSGAENVTGLKSAAEAVDVQVQRGKPGGLWLPQRNEGLRAGVPVGRPAAAGREALITAWAW